MKKTVTTVKEYGADGNLVRETITEVTEEITDSTAPLQAQKQAHISTSVEHPWWNYTLVGIV